MNRSPGWHGEDWVVAQKCLTGQVTNDSTQEFPQSLIEHARTGRGSEATHCGRVALATRTTKGAKSPKPGFSAACP